MKPSEQLSEEQRKRVQNADIKYLADGRIVRVLARPAPDRIVVELGNVYAGEEDEEPFFDGTEIVKAVYDKPPTEAIEKSIVKLEQRREALQAEVSDLDARERAIKQRIETMKKYKPLERIEDFLSGKITHYVIWNGYMEECLAPHVSAVEDERSGNGNKYEDLKLLTLYGSKNRTMEWKLNYYSDGSGGGSNCIPFCSLDEAVAKAKEMLAQSFSKYKWPNGGSIYTAEQLIKAAKAIGAPIPEGFEQRFKEHQIKGFEAEIRKCEQQRDDWQKKLDAAIAQER